MALSIVMAVSADVDAKVGTNAPGTYTDAMKDSVGGMAENYLCCLTGFDLIGGWATLTANGKKILTDYVSSAIAMFAISDNMSAYTTRMEAETMLSLNWAIMQKSEELIKVQDVITYLGA